MHPYMFFVELFGLFGEGAAQFAKEYPYVIYSWVLMIFLIVMGALAAKGVQLIPGKFQNFMEVVISGIAFTVFSRSGW